MDEIAGMARGDGVKDGQEKAAQLINDLQDISLSKIGLIVLGTWIAIALARRVLPYLAEKGPSQLRLYLLGAVPIIRLALLVVAILWLIPILFNITFQNFLVISGAASVMPGRPRRPCPVSAAALSSCTSPASGA